MPDGRKKIFLTKLTDVASADKEGIGTLRREGDDVYIYLKGVATMLTGKVVTVSSDGAYTTALLTRTLGGKPRRLAIAMAAILASKWGWFQIMGTAAIWAGASCPHNEQLYTHDGVPGSVDNDASSEHAIHGMVLGATVGGATAVVAAQISHPWTAPIFD
jgi:hypothetical protein